MKPVMILPLIVFCAAFARVTPAQPPPAKPAPSNHAERSAMREGTITGRVIGADGQPAPDAGVYVYRISENPGMGYSAACDDDGNFKVTGLSPGAYAINVSAPGYTAVEVPTENNIHRIGENVTISLVKGAVITGRVTDEAGEPIVGVSVTPYRLRDLEGRATNSRFGNFGAGSVGTDDRGIYRIYGLRSGVYIVRIGSEDEFEAAQVMRDAPTYYPSATRDTAGEINLRSGEEVSGIDIRHRGDRGHIVSGAISGEVESSPDRDFFSVMLTVFESGRVENEATVSGTPGFALYGVPDGEYELTTTRTSNDGGTSSSARRRVSVKGADVSGVVLKLSPHGSIAGRVLIESSNPPKRCAINGGWVENKSSGQIQEQAVRQSVVVEVLLRTHRDNSGEGASRPRSSWLGRYGRPPNEKGEFALKGLEAGRYRITANLPDEGWRIRAITQPGQSGAGTTKSPAGAAKNAIDAARNGIAIKPGEKLSGVEMIIAEDAATLNGRVVPAKDGAKLPTSLRAHLIPAEAAGADDVIRYAETDVRDDGSFEFKHIAPGQYLLHARRITEKEVNEDQVRPAAWDAVERGKLRREAAAAKNEIELKACQRVKDHVLRW